MDSTFKRKFLFHPTWDFDPLHREQKVFKLERYVFIPIQLVSTFNWISLNSHSWLILSNISKKKSVAKQKKQSVKIIDKKFGAEVFLEFQRQPLLNFSMFENANSQPASILKGGLQAGHKKVLTKGRLRKRDTFEQHE